MKPESRPLNLYRRACLGLLAAGAQALAAAEAGPSLVPAPLEVQLLIEGFVPDKHISIDLGGEDALLEAATWLAGLIAEASGSELVVGDPGSRNGIRLARVNEEELRARFAAAGHPAPRQLHEAYSLRVESTGVTVEATAEAGIFYGLVSLWQWLSALPPGATQWPGVVLLDAPEFAWRGLMLDSARHLQSVAFIKRYLDWMALHKLNMFHWHLTDDQAWRLEVKAWPRLAHVGGFRVPAGAAPEADIDPATGAPRLYGGYFTHEQVREVVAHATRRQITVVPEIDMPGHATAAIAAYPELGVDGHGIDRVPADWGIYPNLFNLEETTFGVLEDVMSEVVALFPGPYVHLGGDEVDTSQWSASDRIRTRMRELGIADLQSVQNLFVERLQAMLEPHGKRVVGWDEILQSNLPADAVVMSWRGVEGAVEAADKGYQAVLSPAPVLYLDHLQTAAAEAPPGRGGVITLRDVYEFDPLPGRLGEQRERLLGLQGNLWTEHVRTEPYAAYMTWPRAAAIAELGWSAPQRRDWDDFARRVPQAMARLQRLGVPAASDEHALYRRVLPPPGGDRREDRELSLCSDAIVLALEDDAPLTGERESFLVDILDPCWIWRDASLASLRAIRVAVGQVPFNFQIGEAIEHVVVEAPDTGVGALLVRLGGCEGPVIAEVPLAPAMATPAVTRLPEAEVVLPADAGVASDLCLRFTRSGVAPVWVLDWVELLRDAR